MAAMELRAGLERGLQLCQAGRYADAEQIYRALELLLTRPDIRRRAQRAGTHLLVDEFQDLTPAFLLLVRLVAGPPLQVFGVGDDDQTIYSYAGASPDHLVDFDRWFPGAAHHALEVNYRCPPEVGRVLGVASVATIAVSVAAGEDPRAGIGPEDHATLRDHLRVAEMWVAETSGLQSPAQLVEVRAARRIHGPSARIENIEGLIQLRRGQVPPAMRAFRRAIRRSGMRAAGIRSPRGSTAIHSRSKARQR